MEFDRIDNRVYVVGRLQKRWIDAMKNCLKKRGMDVRQPERMVHERSKWLGFVRGDMWGIAWGMNP